MEQTGFEIQESLKLLFNNWTPVLQRALQNHGFVSPLVCLSIHPSVQHFPH